MPRQLLRDGKVVADEWVYSTEVELTTGVDSAAALIVPMERWLSERERWLKYSGRLGVVLLPADKVEMLAADVSRFALIAAQFPGPSDGRGYTQGRLVRERYRFNGELRAAGYVRRDQLFFLARCGFNSFQLPETELASAIVAFSTYSAEYQPSNDCGLQRTLQHRAR